MTWQPIACQKGATIVPSAEPQSPQHTVRESRCPPPHPFKRKKNYRNDCLLTGSSDASNLCRYAADIETLLPDWPSQALEFQPATFTNTYIEMENVDALPTSAFESSRIIFVRARSMDNIQGSRWEYTKCFDSYTKLHVDKYM